ncbi:nuclear transport factor 2 family protein [Streptomyces sp. NPDC048253]|uniref:nuclear transport factor 2 family protein n=1 Tax=Streptomyces sp. NPDC048253 TaxID=3365524 RepID=UPI0037183C17
MLVHVDGERAKATANQLVYFYRDGEPPHRTSGLRSACTAVLTSAGWRFSEMRITLAWTQGPPRVVPAPGTGDPGE